MRLLIISHTAHYLRHGEIVGWGPTVREIDHLAHIFDEIRHIAFLHSDPAPETSLPYSSKRVSLIPVKPSGGSCMRKKLGILARAPNYISVMKTHLGWADVVHVRCAANISMMAVLLLGFIENPKYRWVKYAGNWSPNGNEPLSFTLQRWWLKKGFHRGIVTVNGSWPGQPPHVHSFLNPCITDEELTWARSQAEGKRLSPPFRFLFAGSLENRKGVTRALHIVAELHRRHVPLRFDLAGDSKERGQFERMARDLGLGDVVHFYGWIARSELNSLYARSHFLLFPSESEGWPKVLSEAMVHGVVPIVGGVGAIPQILAVYHSGTALPIRNQDHFVEVVLKYIENPQKWHSESKNGISAAESFTYTSYLRELTALLNEYWGITLRELPKPFIGNRDF